MAKRSFIGVSCFCAVLALGLLDLNAVGFMVFGISQMFSWVTLGACLLLLLVYQLTVYRDLGISGRIYFAFILAYIAIGTPVNLHADAEGIFGRWHELRAIIPAILLAAAGAVGARNVFLAYGERRFITIMFIAAICLSSSILLAYFFPQVYTYTSTAVQIDMRSSGSFGNPNEAGAAACVAAAIMFAMMMMRRRRITSLVALAVATAATMSTFSRGAVVILLVLCVAQVFISPGLGKLIALAVGPALVLAIVVIIFRTAAGTDGVALERVQQRRVEALKAFLQGDTSDETTGGRTQLAMRGIQKWLENPLLGNGLGSLRKIGEELGPHNTYIRVIGEAGVVPAVLFVAVFVALFVQGWYCPVPSIRTLVMGYVVVVALRCLTSHGVVTDREHSVMLGVCFGALAACRELHPRGKQAPRRARAPSIAPRPGAMPSTAG